jgi:hypothetical protein
MIEWISDLENTLPPLSSADDLVKAGVYGCIKSASNDRYVGKGPEYIRLQRRIRYPRKAVIKWIEGKVRR